MSSYETDESDHEEEYYLASSDEDQDHEIVYCQLGRDDYEASDDPTLRQPQRRRDDPRRADAAAVIAASVSMEPEEVFQCGHPNVKLAKMIEKSLRDRQEMLREVESHSSTLMQTRKEYRREQKQVTEAAEKVEQMKDSVARVTTQVRQLQDDQQETLRRRGLESEKMKQELKTTRDRIALQQQQLEAVQEKIQQANDKVQQVEQLKQQVGVAQAKRDRFVTECKSQQELYEQEVRSYEAKFNDIRSKQVEADMVGVFIVLPIATTD